jgi:hypothetical protein
MPRSRGSLVSEKTDARLVRLPGLELEAWRSEASLAGESLSTFARAALGREVVRRRGARVVELERAAADPFGLDAILEQGRASLLLPPAGRR